MMDRVRTSVEDRVAVVTLNRPDKHNALDLPMFDALVETGLEIAADRSIRPTSWSTSGIVSRRIVGIQRLVRI